MIKVILADDNPILTEGLAPLLAKQNTLEVVATADGGLAVLQLLPDVMPDVIVTDIQMTDLSGIELTKDLTQYYPQIKVIGLTSFKEDHLIVDMLEAGAKGYLIKTCTRAELTEAIQAVHAGGYYFCNSTTVKLTKLIGSSRISGFAPPTEQFTPAELEIIQLMCQEFSSKEIGRELNLGLRTIESYRHRIFEKTGARNMVGVVVYAIKTGLYRV